MITLKKITIEGYKSIAKAEVELRDLNVIVGANGSGKSNFLGGLQLALKVLTSSEKAKVELLNADRLLHHGGKITREIRCAINTKQFEYDLLLAESFDKLLLTDESIRPQTHKAQSAFELAESKIAVQNDIQSFGHYNFEDASDTSSAKRTNDLHDNRYFRPDAANLAAYLYRLKVNHPSEFSRIQECISLVAPYFEHFILEPQEVKGGFIKLEWKQKNSNAYFDAYSLSSGTLRFICLATLLMQPEPPALILLDEPELGLHPFAILLLAEMLQSVKEKSQVILATQSVTLLDHFSAEDMIIAEHDGSATTFNRLDEAALKPWLEDYSLGKLWEKNVFGGQP